MGTPIVTSMSIASRQRFVPRSAVIRPNSTAMSSREVLLAVPVNDQAGLRPSWLAEAFRRIDELSNLPEGWDSYGGSVLQDDAADALVRLLNQLNSVIQSPPSISLTGTGGLVAEWQSAQSSLELLANPEGTVSVYYCDMATNAEREMPATQCDLLEKWLWQASARA